MSSGLIQHTELFGFDDSVSGEKGACLLANISTVKQGEEGLQQVVGINTNSEFARI